MEEGFDRMQVGHSRAGVSHDGADLFSHIRSVAVDGAFRAGCFTLFEGALIKPLLRIYQQALAAPTNSPLRRTVMSPTIDG
jgi:hypothetical protein